MPPVTAWGWNPQLQAAGRRSLTACPETEAATNGKTVQGVTESGGQSLFNSKGVAYFSPGLSQ